MDLKPEADAKVKVLHLQQKLYRWSKELTPTVIESGESWMTGNCHVRFGEQQEETGLLEEPRLLLTLRALGEASHVSAEMDV